MSFDDEISRSSGMNKTFQQVEQETSLSQPVALHVLQTKSAFKKLYVATEYNLML